MQTPRSEKMEREEVLQVPAWTSTLQLPWWSRYFSAASGEDHTKADFQTVAHEGLHAGVDGYFLKDSRPWRRPTLKHGKGVRRKEQHRGTGMG